jgi:hypothetical protein
MGWCKLVVRVITTPASDHDGVRLHLQSPNEPVRIKYRLFAHMVPPYGMAVVRATMAESFQAFIADLIHSIERETLAEEP